MKLTGYILMMEDGSMKYTTTDKTNIEPEFNGKKVKDRKVRVIPGFHLTLGITVTMLSLIVLIPLASVMVYSLKLSPGEFMALVTKKNVVNETIKNEKVKEELKKMKSTEKGYVNDNNQRNNGRTNKPGTDYGQWFYEMECLNSNCGHKYYANGTDIWLRKCPKCQGGRP